MGLVKGRCVSSKRVGLLPLRGSLCDYHVALQRVSTGSFARVSQLRGQGRPGVRFAGLVHRDGLFRAVYFFLQYLPHGVGLVASGRATNVVGPLYQVVVSQCGGRQGRQFGLDRDYRGFVGRTSNFY